MLCHEGSINDLMHYLDDFLNMSTQSKEDAERQLKIISELLEYLGMPMAPEKVKGPLQVIIFLGTTLDTLLMEARLPDKKLQELRQLVQQFASRVHK